MTPVEAAVSVGVGVLLAAFGIAALWMAVLRYEEGPSHNETRPAVWAVAGIVLLALTAAWAAGWIAYEDTR